MAAGDNIPSPSSYSNGVPRASHTGASRIVNFCQQGTQSAAPCVTGVRHDRHLGGVSRSTKPRQALFARPCQRWSEPAISCIGSSMSDTETPRLFDRALYLSRQAKASPAVTAPLLQRVAEEFADRVDILMRSFDRVLLISSHADAFAPVLRASGKTSAIEIHGPVAADDLQLSGPYNAIFSLLDLHAVDDVPGYLAQVSRALLPDGLVMLSFFAGDTLAELRDSWLAAEVELSGGASPRVAPMIALREMGGLLQRAHLALPVVDLDRITLRYADAFALMREVKAAGFANPMLGRSFRFVSRRFLLGVANHYQEHYADADGRVRATVEIAWANAWKPHLSQPQALKPGSAKARLADALKVPERKV